MWMLLKKIPATWIIIIILGFGLWGMWGMWQSEREERIRVSNNQSVLFDQVNGIMQTYMVRDSLNAARVEALNLTVKEFKGHFVELNGLVKDMRVKLNRLQSVSTVATQTDYNIITTVRDSIVLREVPIAVQRVDYADRWLTFSGMIENKQLFGSFQTRDTLIQVIHRVPRQFLFIRYGTKGIRQEVVSKNPYSTITYNQFLRFEK